MYFNDKTLVFFDGKFIKASEVGVSPYAQSLHYGLGVFEGIRAYQTRAGVRLFKAHEHFVRFRQTAAAIHLPLAYDPAELETIAYRLLEENKLQSAYVRPLLISHDNMTLQPSEHTLLFMGAWKWPKLLGDKLLNVCISSYQRPGPQSFPQTGKISGTYANSVLANHEAKRGGFDEAILLDQTGNVAQAASSNIFMEKNGVLFTPPLGNIFPGITRQTIFELAKQHEIEIVEKHFGPEELKQADAAMLTGTATEVVGITSVDKINLRLPFAQSKCAQLAEAYQEMVWANHESAYTII